MAGCLQCLAHLVVGRDHDAHLLGFVIGRLLHHHVADKTAQVVLQVVDTPGSVKLRVLLLMAVRSFVAGAGLGSRRRVDANLEPLGMDIIGQGLHVGKLVVRVQYAVGVALAFPRVVNVHVDVSSVLHPGGDNLVGGSANVLVGHLPGEVIPTVPAHGGRLRHLCRGRDCGDGSQGKNGERERSENTHKGPLENDFRRNLMPAVRGSAMGSVRLLP